MMTTSTGTPKTFNEKREDYVRRYADGKPRPRFRGVLHAVVASILVFPLSYLVIGLFAGLIDYKYHGIAGFIAGKGVSYGASAFLHLYNFRNVRDATTALKVDLVGVSLNIWSTPSPTMLVLSDEWVLHMVIGVAFTLTNAALVHWQFKGHIGLDTPKNRSDVPRTILIVLQFAWAMYHVGSHFGFQGLWYGAGVFYLLAFACSIPVTNSHSQEACLQSIIPWHKIQHYGFHEDFHALLLVADIFAIGMGIKLMLDPSIDQNPSLSVPFL